MFNINNAILKHKNARNVPTQIPMIATPQLSVPPLVESHTLNAFQVPESASNAPQAKPTQLATKLRRLVTKSAAHT